MKVTEASNCYNYFGCVSGNEEACLIEKNSVVLENP